MSASGSKPENYMHWFCLSYRGVTLEGRQSCDASCYRGYVDKRLTLPRIAEGKRGAGVTDKSVLVSATYLGCMQREQFEGGE